MGIDLRSPIGLLLLIVGLLLAGFGVMSDPKLYTRSLGINVNLWWGWVLILVGGCLLVASFRGRRNE